MYEYNSDKILQRQKVCLKCRSFVTHEKVDDSGVVCPLCGNHLKPPRPRNKPISSSQMKKIIAEFYKEAIAREKAKNRK